MIHIEMTSVGNCYIHTDHMFWAREEHWQLPFHVGRYLVGVINWKYASNEADQTFYPLDHLWGGFILSSRPIFQGYCDICHFLCREEDAIQQMIKYELGIVLTFLFTMFLKFCPSCIIFPPKTPCKKRSGPRLNIKTVLSTYGDFHVKDKTAVRTSYL